MVSLFLGSAIHAVESFFVLSGFCLAYNFFEVLKKSPKRNMIKYIFGKIITRFFSINVIFIVVMLIAVTVAMFLNDTSQFLMHEDIEGNCKKYWWRNVLLISNLFSSKEICMTWSWYAAVDFQLLLVGGILLTITAK